MTRSGSTPACSTRPPTSCGSLWKRIEALGFDWISVWDHFYGATGQPDDAACLEAVAMHAALACETERVECGCLVYSIGYRHPAVLAKAITTIDLLSGGRAAMGIGAGWAEVEYDAYGIDFPPIGTRMDQLEEGIAVLRGPAARRGDDVRRGSGSQLHRRPQRAAPGAGQAADLDRRRRRAAHAAHRRPVRRRVERAVRRRPRRSPPSATCCTATAPTSAATRPRSAAPSTSGWRGPRRACSSQFGAIADVRAPGRARRFGRRGRRPHRRVRRRRRRPGEPRAAGAVRRRRARAVQRRR